MRVNVSGKVSVLKEMERGDTCYSVTDRCLSRRVGVCPDTGIGLHAGSLPRGRRRGGGEKLK